MPFLLDCHIPVYTGPHEPTTSKHLMFRLGIGQAKCPPPPSPPPPRCQQQPPPPCSWHLTQQYSADRVQWVNFPTESGKPYDITVEINGELHFIEVCVRAYVRTHLCARVRVLSLPSGSLGNVGWGSFLFLQQVTFNPSPMCDMI